LVFIGACEDLIRADDVVMFSNPLVVLVKKEKLEES